MQVSRIYDKRTGNNIIRVRAEGKSAQVTLTGETTGLHYVCATLSNRMGGGIYDQLWDRLKDQLGIYSND